ncbi:MAG: TrkA family potassium uptake protein [Bacilli bacterium]
MKKSFAIIGLGRFGLKLVEELSKAKVDVMALDLQEENVIKASEFIDNAYVCDTTNEVALKELGVNNVDHAVVAFGSNLQNTIMTTIILKEFGVHKITVRVDDDFYIPVIKKLGATDIVSPQKIAGIRLANKILSDNFIDFFNIDQEFSVIEIVVRPDVESMTIQDLNPRNNYGVNLLLIRRDQKSFSPTAIDNIIANDHLFVFGTTVKVSKFERLVNASKE